MATLHTHRELRVVNCTSDDKDLIYLGSEPAASERERACWRAIDRAFARPVDRSDDSPDYVPTQILAEMFRRDGLDGIGYRSSLGPGHNIVLFDVDAASVTSACVFQVDSINVLASQSGNPYSVRPQREDKRTED